MNCLSNRTSNSLNSCLSAPRRRFIQATVTGGLTGLAGCSNTPSNSEGSNDNQNSTDTENSVNGKTISPSDQQSSRKESENSTVEDTPGKTGENNPGTDQYEHREGCSVVISAEMRLDETVMVYPINGDPETEGIRSTYQGIDVEEQGEVRVEFLGGFTVDLYIKQGERMDIDAVTGIELTELVEEQIQVQFLRIPEGYESRGEWEPAEVELC